MSRPNKLTPEQEKDLRSFLLAQEKQEAASIRAETISCLRTIDPHSKPDLYWLASQFNATPAEPEVPRALPVSMDTDDTPTLSLPEKYVRADGTLQNINNSDTINTIFWTGEKPQRLTLTIPSGITEARKVAKNTPHTVVWDEAKNSYVYESGPAKWLRPFIKTGMKLVIETTETDNQQTATPEEKNEKLFTDKPGYRELIGQYLPLILGEKNLFAWSKPHEIEAFSRKITPEKMTDYIKQFQIKNGIEPADGLIQEPTEKILTQACAQRKIEYFYKNGIKWGNIYLPDGVSFTAPVTDAEIAKMLKPGETVTSKRDDINQQCASLIVYTNRWTGGNAWNIGENIIKRGWREIANCLRWMTWWTNTKAAIEAGWENKALSLIQQQIREQVKKNPIDPTHIQVGDTITMMHPGSRYQIRAYEEWRSSPSGIVSTHVGQVTEADGQLYVTHNIHGTLHTEPLAQILSGTGHEWDLATGVFRNESMDPIAQKNPQKGPEA